MNVLVFLWNAGADGHAGGFVRTTEILRRVGGASYDVIDRAPTIVEETMHVRVLPYRLPKWVDRVTLRNYALGRFADWMLSLAYMIVQGAVQTKRQRYDRIYAPNSELFPVAVAAFVVGKARGIPIVFTNLNVRGVPGWVVTRVLHQHVDRLITLTKSLESEIRGEGIHAPIDIVGVGVDDRSTPRPQSTKTVIFVGRHTEAKGAFDLIPIFALVLRTVPDARLLLCGPCSDPVRHRLEAAIVALNLDSTVEICGPVDEATKWRLYAAAAVCLFPSYVEGWGIVPVEAILSGTAVVAYDLAAYQETIAGMRGVALVPEGDLAAAACAVIAFLKFPDDERTELAISMKEAGSQFSWQPIVHAEEQAILREVVV